jgi:hypothetical protein
VIELRVMEIPSLFDGLSDIGLRGGVDMRPTLIRVLTDLYVQKLKHTADEERRYTELALRLLDGVNAQTRATIAARLAPHLAPPLRVVQYLVKDLPEVAAPLRGHAVLRVPTEAEPPATVSAPVIIAPIKPVEPVAIPEPEERRNAPDNMAIEDSVADEVPPKLDPATANELNTLFFASTEEERRLILLNLHIVVPLSAGEIIVVRDTSVAQRLEAAALGRHREDLARQFALALHISHEQARRITRDNFGEPMVVAIKALSVPRDVFHRILMFANPTVGHSVERVQSLATLFDEMTLPAAEGMVEIWQSLEIKARSAANHQPIHSDDQSSRARPTVAISRRPQTGPRTTERRNVS